MAKGKGGKGEPPSDAAPPYAVAPWRPPSGQLASAELPRTDDSTVQELLGAIRSTMTMTQQGLPTQAEEAMAKLEQNTGRLVTKSIHSQTTAMGAARKQLQNIKESKRSQEASWVEFLNSTVTALEKGSQRFQETMADLDAKEIGAAKKLAAARKAIRALAGDKEPPEAVGSADEDGESDVELMEDTAVVDLPSGEDTKIMQAHKKLRVTLDSLLTKLPVSEDGTPGDVAEDPQRCPRLDHRRPKRPLARPLSQRLRSSGGAPGCFCLGGWAAFFLVAFHHGRAGLPLAQ